MSWSKLLRIAACTTISNEIYLLSLLGFVPAATTFYESFQLRLCHLGLLPKDQRHSITERGTRHDCQWHTVFEQEALGHL
jgi:hypothetical protein